MSTVATVVLDDVDVTAYCQSGSMTKRLNAISTAAVTLPMTKIADLYGTFPMPDAGSYLKIYLANDTFIGSTPVLYFHGRVMLRELTANEDNGYVVFNASDALELWKHRPVRADDGDFSKPDDLLSTYIYGPQIVQAMMANSENAGAGPPSDAEGPLRMRLNSVAGGVTSVEGAPTDWPMTMAQLATLLISTGTLDIVITPIEFDVDDNYNQCDLYNGDYGQDLTSTVVFEYGTGARNVRALRWNRDMSDMCNKLWYYLGPRVETSDDPAGDQHWRANITGDDPFLAYPPGGALSPPASPLANIIGTHDYFSRITWDVRMDIRIYDARGDEALVARDLYRRLWQLEQFLRAYPREILHVTPTRDSEIGAFDIGDLVGIDVTTDAFGGITGGQRVYSWSLSWNAPDSVCELGELQVSSDNEDFG